MKRPIKRVLLALQILFLRWDISQWKYGMNRRSAEERKLVRAEQTIREVKLMILRMEYNNL